MEGFVSFEVPYPPKALWPNGGSAHWAVKDRAFKAQKAFACYALRAVIGPRGKPVSGIEWQLVFHPKTRHQPDADNAMSSAKAIQDGIAQALGVDDKIFPLPKLSFGEPVKGGKVVVWVKAL